MYRNVCEVIVPNDLCIGCGLCVGVCPPDVLQMKFNEGGEYIPLEYRDGCLPKCDLCLRACPFWEQEDNETSLAEMAFASHANYHPDAGYFLDCYVGHVLDETQRLASTSGGLMTWFLGELLNKNIVDRVVCVIENDDPEKLYKFAVLDTAQDVYESSRSCYYPVELGDITREIIHGEDLRYAIAGLPCLLKGLRLAMRKNRRLRQRVKALVGMVCGQTKSKFFVEYLASLQGGDPHHLRKAEFRIKDPARTANDYGHELTWLDESRETKRAKIFWTEGIDQAWMHSYFKPNACNFCDDVFAETADVVFMDAWLPAYNTDYRGHTIVINRHEQFQPIWDDAQGGDRILLERIDVQTAVKSQQGVIKEKKQGMQYRLWLAQEAGERIPRKRLPPSNDVGTPIDRYVWRLKRVSNRLSKQVWIQEKRAERLHQSLKTITWRIRLVEITKKVVKMVQEGRIQSAILKRLRRQR